MPPSVKKVSIKQAVVLAGGFGTRLGHLTRTTPKPLLPVGGQPFMSYQLAWLARHGIEDIIISTGYLAEAFDAYLASQTLRGPYGNPIRVRCLREDAPAGTGGALKVHEAELAERFLLINGDSFFDCALAEIINLGEQLGPNEALLTVRHVADAGRYGRITLDGESVTRFEEKSSAAGAGLINAGITVLNRDVVNRITTLPYSIENDIYPVLAGEGLLRASIQDGFFIDIGLPETYEAAQTEIPAAVRKPALFLDRDGVINPDVGYLHRIEDFVWLPGVIDGIALARRSGFHVVVVTNQAGVARGYYDEAAVERLHRHINAELHAQSAQPAAWIDAFYYCPYHPDGTVERYRQAHPDRKPEPGMLLRAINDLGIDVSRSLLIGDQESDLQAARAAAIAPYHIGGEAVSAILRRHLASL